MNNFNLKYHDVNYDGNEYINIIPKKNNDKQKQNKLFSDNYPNDNDNDNNNNCDIENNKKNKTLNEILIKNQKIEEENKNIIISHNQNDIYEDYKELKKEFNNFLENVLLGTTKIKNIIKKMDKQTQKNETNKIKQLNKKNTINKDKGFAEEKNVPKSIQVFFNLEPEIKMPRTKIGGLFQDYLKNNNLKGNIGEKNKIDKRIYRLDDKLSKLFNVSEEQIIKINSCSSSKIKYPNGYNFHNYQTWIKKIYNEEKN